MPTQPLAIAMRSFRRNTHVESAFSNMFFAKTHQNSSWILGPCNFGKSFKAVFFFVLPALQLHRDWALAPSWRQIAVATALPVDHRWWENARNPERRIDLPECYKFILMQPASCCDIRLLQRNFLFNQSETLNVYGIHLPYNVANFVGINVGPISAIHWVSRNEYHPIFSYLPTMFNFADPSLNWGSFLLSLQICSGTPSIGEKDVFSAAWSRLPGLLMRRRFHEGAKQVVHLWQHILELWLDIMSIIVIIFHTYVGSGPKRCNSC